MSTTRRRLLVATGAVVGLGALTYGGSLFACARRDARAAALLGAPERLFAALPGVADPARVGGAVLAGRAGLAAERLLPDLAAEPSLRAACRLACPATRAAALAAAFRAEFAAGRFVLADGWVVAASEARIAALWLAAGRPDPLAA